MESVWMADWIDVFIGLRFSLWPGWVLAAPIILYSIEVEMLERVQKVYFGSWESYYASQTTRLQDHETTRLRDNKWLPPYFLRSRKTFRVFRNLRTIFAI